MRNDAIPPTKGWATARQIAARYGVTKPTVFNWLHAGIIPAMVAVGRIYRFDMEEVDAALALRSCRTGKQSSAQARVSRADKSGNQHSTGGR